MSQKRSGIQLAEPFSESRLLNKGRYHTKWSPPYLLQPKLNGERCRVLNLEGGRTLLLSSTEEIISSVPHINKEASTLPVGEYDGELYTHGLTWSEIHSIVSRTTSLHPNHEVMNLHLFDIVTDGSQIERISKMVELKKSHKSRNIHFIFPTICWNLDEIYSSYDQFISQGYEGFIIRNMDSFYVRKRTGNMMKFKPKETDEYEIVGVYEAISAEGKPKNMVGGFNCIDDMGTVFQVGAGKLPHEKRKELWEMWLDSPHYIKHSYLKVEYQTLSDKNKVPLFSRAVTII